MAANFLNRNTTNSSRNRYIPGPVWAFGQNGDAMRRCGINRLFFTGILLHEAVLRVQRSHVTSAIPTFCLACRDGALCWRSSGGPALGGASGLAFSVSIYASFIQKCQHSRHAPRWGGGNTFFKIGLWISCCFYRNISCL